MLENSWDDLVAGKGCQLCQPRAAKNEFSVKVKDLTVSTLFLDRNQVYRGYCVLVFNQRHVTGMDQLSDAEYKSFTEDLRQAMQAISHAVKPDHMNYASLGNLVPHLHCHIFPRYKTDPRWRFNPFCPPATGEMPYQQLASEAEYDQLVASIMEYLN